MEMLYNSEMLLDAFHGPAFTVIDGKICKVNLAAQKYMLCVGAPIDPLLGIHADTYHALENGCLCTPVQFDGLTQDFCIYKADGVGYFIANTKTPDDLRCMALAAVPLRNHLANISALADMLSAEKNSLSAELNREIHRMSRLVCNMSDAADLYIGSNQHLTDMSAMIAEVFDSAGTLLETIGITLHYKGIRKPVRGYADSQAVRRAIWNLISNSAKFMPSGGQLHATLSQHGNYLQLTLQDTGEGIDPMLLPTVFSRYRREAAIEDSRYGIGLGLLIAGNIIRAHGGTLLIESIKGQGTRLTLTLSISNFSKEPLVSSVRSPDYAGGRDQALQELADILPASFYE